MTSRAACLQDTVGKGVVTWVQVGVWGMSKDRAQGGAESVEWAGDLVMVVVGA